MKNFKVGQKFNELFLNGTFCFSGEIIKRSGKTITIETTSGICKKKVFVTGKDKVEFIFPLGNYARCPFIKAK